MRFIYVILILIFSIVIQTSFVRLFDIFSFMPNLALIVLFMLCYTISFEKILFLAIVAGISMDLSSSVNFGSSSLAAFGAFSLSFYLRENVLKGGRLADFYLNSLITFFAFYFLLGVASIYLGQPTDNAEFPLLININLIGEILSDFMLSIFGFYLIGYYSNNKIYGFTRNIKIPS